MRTSWTSRGYAPDSLVLCVTLRCRQSSARRQQISTVQSAGSLFAISHPTTHFPTLSYCGMLERLGGSATGEQKCKHKNACKCSTLHVLYM